MLLCPPWMVWATSGLVVLGLLYYVSWTYLARWLCKRLLKGRVTFVGSSEKIFRELNGIKEERIPSRSPDDEWKDPDVGVKDTSPDHECRPTPRFVISGILAEISQL